MSTTKTLIAAALIAVGAAAAPVFAQSYSHLEPITTTSQKTRAEVLADLQIYRDSGLALVDSTEELGFDNTRRQQAQARYEQLRNSPTYAALVKRFSEEEAGKKHVAAR
ncbi:Domain of unknown function [Roseateles sp. YR242]|uniref:DUF4148 domain-containing protein n=1 Tax=Roseateles sp. YR242 TaxID=1855305 RepID=UPI0008AC788C|nr:DUF4148 domain-containing protein [Roseateles sp. YR242]SEL84592.1 Domain of unknown function [Roseateles sp. YR242]